MSKLKTNLEGAASSLTLKDGTVVTLGGLGPGDTAELENFVNGLSEETIYYRFLTAGASREVLVQELSPKDGCFTLGAKKDDRILGIGSFCRTGQESAEIGLIIAEDYQGRGLGTGMIEMIARAANKDGVTVLEAVIGWNNTRMIRMVRSLGFPTSEKVEPDLIHIRFPTSIDPVSLAEFQERWVFAPS